METRLLMNNLKIGHRLIGSFLIMALMVGITGIYGAVSMQKMGERIQDIIQNLTNQRKLVLLMEVTQKDARILLMQAVTSYGSREKFEEYAEEQRFKRDLFLSQCDILIKGNPKLGIKPARKGGAFEQRLKVAMEKWNRFSAISDEMLNLKGQLFTVGRGDSHDPRLDTLLERDIEDASEEAKEAVDDLMVNIGAQITQSNDEISRIEKNTLLIFMGSIVAAIGVALILGFLATRYILVRIKEIGKAVDRGADGDLSARVECDSFDELGKLSSDFNNMVDRLSEMVTKIGCSTVELKRISGIVTDASRQVSIAAGVQVNGINETSNAVVEISSSVKVVARNVDNLSTSASESSSSILEMAASIEEVALNVETLSQSVSEVSSSVVEMTASIKQISSSAQKLMDASTTTACSIAQMGSSIKQVERNALDTVAISDEVRNDAVSGRQSVEATIHGINEIRRASRIASDSIESLYAKAEDIGKILQVIDEVAEQTNLLALNAAIIAAQAGSYGKGFAVVADEIKELSERTSSSTREISEVIKGVQEETRRAVEAIELAENSIRKGEILSQNSGEALNKIVIGVEKSTDRMSEIARATIEQSKGSQMIREAMEQVSDMVSQIARATEEQSRGSDLIMTEVERMKGLTTEVRRSTKEQSKVGNFIARSTENITAMISQIKNATDEQERNSEQIVHAVKEIQKSTNINSEATRGLNEAVASLSEQTELLQEEMKSFKI